MDLSSFNNQIQSFKSLDVQDTDMPISITQVCLSYRNNGKDAVWHDVDPRRKRRKYCAYIEDAILHRNLPVYIDIPDISAFQEEVKCPICLGTLTATKRVNVCMHRFCQECLNFYIRNHFENSTSKFGSNTGRQTMTGCPLCKEHIGSSRQTKSDEAMDKLIALLGAQENKVPQRVDLNLHNKSHTGSMDGRAHVQVHPSSSTKISSCSDSANKSSLLITSSIGIDSSGSEMKRPEVISGIELPGADLPSTDANITNISVEANNEINLISKTDSYSAVNDNEFALDKNCSTSTTDPYILLNKKTRPVTNETINDNKIMDSLSNNGDVMSIEGEGNTEQAMNSVTTSLKIGSSPDANTYLTKDFTKNAVDPEDDNGINGASRVGDELDLSFYRRAHFENTQKIKAKSKLLQLDYKAKELAERNEMKKNALKNLTVSFHLSPLRRHDSLHSRTSGSNTSNKHYVFSKLLPGNTSQNISVRDIFTEEGDKWDPGNVGSHQVSDASDKTNMSSLASPAEVLTSELSITNDPKLIQSRFKASKEVSEAPLTKPFIRVDVSAKVKDIKQYLKQKKQLESISLSIILHGESSDGSTKMNLSRIKDTYSYEYNIFIFHKNLLIHLENETTLKDICKRFWGWEGPLDLFFCPRDVL